MQSMHALSHCFFKIDRRFVTYFATQKSGSSAALWVRFGQMPLTICARATPLGSFGRIDRRSEPVGFDRPKCPLAHPLGSIGQNGVFAGPTALGSFGNNCPGGPSRIDTPRGRTSTDPASSAGAYNVHVLFCQPQGDIHRKRIGDLS
jgi:hypothetical protein